MQPFAGYLLDRIGLHIGLALFAVAWGSITMAHGLANGWQSLAGLRGAMGVAEGSGHPGGLKVVAEYFPAKERGFATGIYNIGAGNSGIGQALHEFSRQKSIIFIGHELTDHSKTLLLTGTMDAVIDQNPRVEAREAIAMLTYAILEKPYEYLAPRLQGQLDRASPGQLRGPALSQA